MRAPSPTVIQVESLSKTFRRDGHDVTVLDDVSLSVAAGRIAGVIGPSGAGKSTLARTINLLECPTSGTVTVAGQELTRLRERDLQAARRRIGTIFQSASLLSSRTVAGNVALPLELAGIGRAERRARVAELVERVGLTHHAGAYPAQLSGGQRQRVGIARALALRPDVLLSDEATSGLDTATTRTILALLRELRDDLGLTILLITHEMDVVRDVCDEVTLLRGGRVVESGALADLVADPRSALGRGLIPERPVGRPAAGREAWRVRYTERQVDPAWLALLQQEVGAPIELLGAAVEAVDGRPAGHVTIALPAGGPDLGALLAERGLDARRLPEVELDPLADGVPTPGAVPDPSAATAVSNGAGA
ncbi:Methionine ABC transporter ATP-binding protein [Patulibacter medicamentivorans]|uniref:Methionine ABC transporter ATP-binding protein n=1 Tax=Patulibacter medicamentivorans TaxID=1097667 RepID=H0E529_9ACTN|nr:ATP-binding cassette domain-containing protein [Patulibacter medicamentivorans]EHN11196.1 Methionine ABC transporter ATP-binding protein [Patulibacter medicamentivorans]